jgi:hypothetical protein
VKFGVLNVMSRCLSLLLTGALTSSGILVAVEPQVDPSGPANGIGQPLIIRDQPFHTAPYMFFSANAEKQADPFRRSYERYLPAEEGSVPGNAAGAEVGPRQGIQRLGSGDVYNSQTVSEFQQEQAMQQLRRLVRQLSELEARHPGTRAAIISNQLMQDAERIRVAPEDRFLPNADH